MKKVFTIILIVTLFFIVGCENKNDFTKDEKKFKEEYESLNGNSQGDHTIMSLDIAEDNQMVYVDSKEVIDILKNKTGVIYFGFPSCPWCRNVVPILIDAAKDTDLNKIYYANLLEERDTKRLENGNIITDKEGSKNYYEILELLKDQLGSYEGLEDESIKRLYFPTVVFVKQGKVEAIHIGTLDSQKDPYKKLSDKKQKELKNIFVKGIQKIQNLTCDTDQTC